MNKASKRLGRLFAKPPPKDFAWHEAVTVLRHAGFTDSCSGGSHYIFHHARTNFTFRLSRPHRSRGSEFLKQYQIHAVIEALEKVGASPDGDDEISELQRFN